MFEDFEKIRSALSYVPNDDRDTWWRMAMAVRDGLGDDGFDIWNDWSASGKNYSFLSCQSTWRSIKPDPNGVSVLSLYKKAREYGWKDNSPRKILTAEEIQARANIIAAQRAEYAEKMAIQYSEAAEIAVTIWDAAQPATDDHPYLVRKQIKAHGLRVGTWTVQKENGEIWVVSDNALLVPVCDRTRKIHSLQAIFPVKVAGRDKDYLAKAAKSGYFHAIGKPKTKDGQLVFLICEGLATGSSLHEATGHCVLVAFDTSNLLPVAKSIRDRLPDAIILFCADNDQFLAPKNDGTPKNPGIEAAKKAAAELNGLVAYPPFSPTAGNIEDGGPTDWNDWAVECGYDSVEFLIEEALSGKEPEPEPEFLPPVDSYDELGLLPQSAEYTEPEDHGGDTELTKNRYFSILGYDATTYYIFSHVKKQILDISKNTFNELGLAELAETNWWEVYFPGNKGGINKPAAFEWMMTVAHSKGIYDPTRIRGRGFWRDEDRFIFHYGDCLSVDGERMDIEAIKSQYVYPLARRLPKPCKTSLTDEEGAYLLSVAEMVRWSMPASAVLMTGWAFLAPICGALAWRPHIWITGSAGSGKSTVQRAFCSSLTLGYSIYAQGSSTEAGIRQTLGADARPVLLDEAESNDEREKQRVKSILTMIRQSSSENQAQTLKGSISGEAMNFHIRSMFCLASINTNLDNKADSDRLTRLVIRPPSADGGLDHWKRLENELQKIETDVTVSNRMVSRALGMLPDIIASIKVFVRVAAKKFSSQRYGDQFGTLAAGCWCLTHSRIATEAEAIALLDRYQWVEHTEDHDVDDSQKALSTIMGYKIRMPSNVGDLTIHELIIEASPLHRRNIVEQTLADRTLKQNGIKIEKDVLLFGTNVPNLKNLLVNTPYSTDIRGQLLRLPGAERYDKAVRFNGECSKCVSIPLSSVLEDPVQTAIFDDEFPL